MNLQSYNNTSNIKVIAGDGVIDGTVTKTYNKITLKPNVIDGKNILTQDIINEPNTIYVFKYDFYIGDIKSKYANISTDNVVTIDETDYYYDYIDIIGNKRIVLLDTEHCVLLNENKEIIVSGEFVSNGSTTIYVASITAGTRANVYSVEDVIIIPENSIIVFDGGSIQKGTLNINGSKVFPSYNYVKVTDDLNVIGNPAISTYAWDYDNNIPIWFDGTNWIKANGDVI